MTIKFLVFIFSYNLPTEGKTLQGDLEIARQLRCAACSEGACDPVIVAKCILDIYKDVNSNSLWGSGHASQRKKHLMLTLKERIRFQISKSERI